MLAQEGTTMGNSSRYRDEYAGKKRRQSTTKAASDTQARHLCAMCVTDTQAERQVHACVFQNVTKR
jgi:hypothetical protein